MAAWFAVPLTCLSNAGRVKKTTVLLASLKKKNYVFYHVEEGVCVQELTSTIGHLALDDMRCSMCKESKKHLLVSIFTKELAFSSFLVAPDTRLP